MSLPPPPQPLIQRPPRKPSLRDSYSYSYSAIGRVIDRAVSAILPPQSKALEELSMEEIRSQNTIQVAKNDREAAALKREIKILDLNTQESPPEARAALMHQRAEYARRCAELDADSERRRNAIEAIAIRTADREKRASEAAERAEDAEILKEVEALLVPAKVLRLSAPAALGAVAELEARGNRLFARMQANPRFANVRMQNVVALVGEELCRCAPMSRDGFMKHRLPSIPLAIASDTPPLLERIEVFLSVVQTAAAMAEEARSRTPATRSTTPTAEETSP